jgi:sirohydrochlorin ferrochelatase
MRPPRLAAVLVAHGSRDPRAAQATEALARAVRRLHPDWDVRASYLDHSVPRPRQVLASFAEAGHRRAVMVPLLLTSAYHGRVDVPGEIAAAQADGVRLDVTLADVLGPVDGRVPPLLLDALATRLAPLGPFDALVLAAAGTKNAAARGTVELAAEALGARTGVPCRVAYASAAPPVSGDVVRGLRAEEHRRIALASYFLAPGLLWDATVASAVEAGAALVSSPMTDAPALAALVAARALAAAPERVRTAA